MKGIEKEIEMDKVKASNDRLSATKDIFRDLTFTGVYQGTTWRFHSYGISCKLSGSVYAVTEIENAVPLVHGPIGCPFHHRLTPRRMWESMRLACTELTENDVIYGGEDRLREKLVETYNKYKPELIAVLPTCVSGLTGDDVKGVIQEVEVPCELLYVPSEGFAHRDRQALDGFLKDYAKAWVDPTESPAYEIRGCGHEEVMLSLAEQMMEERDVEERSVNIETSYGRFNYGARTQLKEMTQLFNKIGIKINTTFLTCTVAELKKAPAAELNIAGRGIEWAKHMKKEFGTDYLQRTFFYSGIEGTEKLLLDIASKFNLEGEAEEFTSKEKNKALQELDRYGKNFENHDFALFTLGFFFTPYSIKTYLDLKIPLKYVCIDTLWLKEHNISDETIELMVRNIEKLIVDWDMGFELVVNPSLNEISEIAKKVDYVLSDWNTMPLYEREGISVINTSVAMYLFYRIGFTGLVELAEYMAKRIKRKHTRRIPIVSRLDYDKIHYPMLADPMCLASHDMWSAMWSLRGE